MNKGYHLQPQPDAATRHSSESMAHRRLNISSAYRDVLPDVRSKASRTQYICALGALYDPGLLSPPYLNVIALPAPPKFIISRWHWQETVFLHNIL